MMHDNAWLNEVRSLILSKFNITIASPSDCQHIALMVSKQLNKTISTTTIKRIFGFAAVKHNFSKFTINSLLEFVDHPNASDAKGIIIKSLDDKKNEEEWLRIALVAKKITQSTLNSIISKCTIPFEYTVVRKFVIKEFEYFYQSNFSFTSFIGQPGYGKSVSLAHVIQHFYLKPKSKYHSDIFLFLNAKDFFTIDDENRDFETEIKRVLNLPADQNIIKLFNSFQKQTGHKVVIIIDSFDGLFSLKKNKSQIIENIIYWLCQIEDSEAIKVVVSLRSNFWSRLYSLIRSSNYLNRKWYKGRNYSGNEMSNVPKLDKQEVAAILQQIDSKSTDLANNFLESKLNYPFYFSYYYSLQKEYNKNKLHTNIVNYEIYWRFILEKIYNSNGSAQKLIICKTIIQFSEYGLKSASIPKKVFFDDFAIVKQAYMELLAEGIIIEHKIIVNGLFVETVGFVHQHFFDYFLCNELSAKLASKITHHEVEKIVLAYSKTFAKSLVKWMIFSTVRNSDYRFIYLLNERLLSQNDLILFLAENIKHQLDLKPCDLALLKKITRQENLLKYNIISSKSGMIK